MRLVLALFLCLPASATSFRIGAQAERSFEVREPVVGGVAPTVAIDPMPFERTVVCMDGAGYGLLGTATDVTSVAWAASPSGESGACTGTTSWDCEIVVAPDAVGEGVETITITATGAGGTGTDTVTIGFYVDGAHSCFLSQNIDGNYNFTLVDTDPVAFWYNVGSSGLDVTQATGTAQPTYRTAIVGGQPVVRCDGGDRVAASTASDWSFMNAGPGSWSTESTFATASSNPDSFQVAWSTKSNCGSTNATNFGSCIATDDRSSVPRNDAIVSNVTIASPASLLISANDTFLSGAFGLASIVVDTALTPNLTALVNDVSFGTTSTLPAGTSLATGPLTLCANAAGGAPLTGDLFRVLIYQIALTSTQRGINKAVDEWALGGTLPVTP